MPATRLSGRKRGLPNASTLLKRLTIAYELRQEISPEFIAKWHNISRQHLASHKWFPRWTMSDINDKLKVYEDVKDQLELPFK